MASRFRFSSPANRGPNDPWFRLGDIEVTTTILGVALGVLAMLFDVAAPNASPRLAMFPHSIRQGEVWRIVTWPLYYPISFWNVITLGFFFWFGRELEARFGRLRFVWFLLALTIVPAVFATAFPGRLNGSYYVHAAELGLSLVELGVFVAFVADSPHARFMFAIPAWVFAAVIVAVHILTFARDRVWESIVFTVVLLITALIALRAFGFGDALAGWVPKLRIPVGGRRAASARSARVRRHAAPDAAPTVIQGPWQPLSPEELARQQRIDSLLDKIAASGLDSLTPEERKWLNDASKKGRDDRR